MCKCKSYNKKVKGAKHPNVILEVPKRLRTKRADDGTEQRTIAVDKCMAKRLVSLWAVGFVAISAAHYADFPAWVRASYSAIMLGGLCGFLKYVGRGVPEK